jgi:hypothetical protein
VLGGIDNALFLSSFGGFAAVGILIFFLKWAFSSNNKKLIVTPISAGKKDEYGLLKALPTLGKLHRGGNGFAQVKGFKNQSHPDTDLARSINHGL